MGLDMYLHSIPRIPGMEWKEILSINNPFMKKDEVKLKIFQTYLQNNEITPGKWKEEVYYWRKANPNSSLVCKSNSKW